MDADVHLTRDLRLGRIRLQPAAELAPRGLQRGPLGLHGRLREVDLLAVRGAGLGRHRQRATRQLDDGGSLVGRGGRVCGGRGRWHDRHEAEDQEQGDRYGHRGAALHQGSSCRRDRRRSRSVADAAAEVRRVDSALRGPASVPVQVRPILKDVVRCRVRDPGVALPVVTGNLPDGGGRASAPVSAPLGGRR